jgi:hypothetical protein
MYGVCIEEDELRCLLSNTPALEWLDVRGCYPITSFRILSYLGITCREKYMVQSIQNKAPNLSSFCFQDEIRVLLLCHTRFSEENQVFNYMYARIKFHTYSDIIVYNRINIT